MYTDQRTVNVYQSGPSDLAVMPIGLGTSALKDRTLLCDDDDEQFMFRSNAVSTAQLSEAAEALSGVGIGVSVFNQCDIEASMAEQVARFSALERNRGLQEVKNQLAFLRQNISLHMSGQFEVDRKSVTHPTLNTPEV